MNTGLWTDVRQRPGLLMRSLTPGFPYPPENVTALIANAISLLEDNYAAIKQEVLRLTHVCLYADCFFRLNSNANLYMTNMLFAT